MDSKTVEVMLPADVSVESAETNVVLAKLGMGIIQVPHYHVAADIAAKRLRAALFIGTSGGFSVGG